LTASIKAENTELRKKIIDLRVKVTTLESAGSPESTSTVIAQILQEFFERERYQTNAIIYGIPDSSSSSLQQRICDDKLVTDNLFATFDYVVPPGLKFIRLGRAKLNFILPLKVMFSKKNDVLALTSAYYEAKKRGIVFPEGV